MTTKVDELRELQVELEHKAFHDPLTGLANRLLFMNRVDFVLKRRTGNAAVIYIDLDNFKPINDTYGHEAGDAVLKAAGERLLASLRPSDTAARLGGDEFAVLLVDIPEEHIGVVADRIVGNLTQAARVRRPRAARSARASASPPPSPARSTPTRSCATPTSRCTSPSTAARAGSACSSGPSPEPVAA